MTRGKFITLEGGEGAGKSTQVKRLAAFLRGQGHEVVQTREVGGSPSAEEIRDLWLGKGEGHWDVVTELLLICAARREHVVKIIWPALERGAWVVCDRFVDSTRAYQGIGLGVGLDRVDDFTRKILGDFEPDMTLLLDLPVDLGLERVRSRCGMDDRFEQKDTAFHQVLRDSYWELAKKYKARFRVIDASGDVEAVARGIEAAVMEVIAEDRLRTALDIGEQALKEGRGKPYTPELLAKIGLDAQLHAAEGKKPNPDVCA